MFVWSGHSCPLLLILILHLNFIAIAKIKGSGQECPLHTNQIHHKDRVTCGTFNCL